MPRIPVHRCRRRGPEPPARLRRHQHGPAVEPGGARAAHRPRASARADQPVRVVNFVAQGTIEEGMLWRARNSRNRCSTGVLDGGEKEVFLGGSRLSKFMETVEKTRAPSPKRLWKRHPRIARPSPKPATELPSRRNRKHPPAGPPPPPLRVRRHQQPPIRGIAPIQTGVGLLEQLAAASRSGRAPRAAGKTAAPGPSIVQRDERTGESYLKLPMPSPEILDKAGADHQRIARRFPQIMGMTVVGYNDNIHCSWTWPWNLRNN